MADILIIGGGIGGLTNAIALQQHGFDTQVYEAAHELNTVGAGIMMLPNAMGVLDKLGLADEVAEVGLPLDRAEIRDLTAGVLQVLDGSEVEARWGHRMVAIRRSELHRVLASAVKPGSLNLDKRLIRLEDQGSSVRAYFEDRTSAEGTILIGADGIHSAVRGQLFPHVSLRYSGQTCFRGLARYSLQGSQQRTAWEVWGGAVRFGFLGVGEDLVYWFAPITAPPGSQLDPTDPVRDLLARYAEFSDPIPGIIRATESEAIIQTDLYDLPPIKTWHKGRVVLVGDAAHATTPNLGQGGAQAIEDALSLVKKITTLGPTPLAFEAFEQVRIPRASKIVTLSRQFGKIAHWENPLLRKLRNIAMRSIPQHMQRRQLDEQFTPRI